MKTIKLCKMHPWCELPCVECEMHDEERERELRKENKRKKKKIRNQFREEYDNEDQDNY